MGEEVARCLPGGGGGAGPPPGARCPGWGAARHLHACPRWLGRIGAATPARPAPAPLPIEGLWGCCETAAPGGGPVPSPPVHPRRDGGGGAREGRGEGHGGLSGRAAQ